MKRIRQIFLIFVMAMATVIMSPSCPVFAQSMNVQSHTADEIRNRIKNSGGSLTDTPVYSETPSTTSPYSPGSLSESTLNSALAVLNNIRYIAGIDADVQLKDSYNSACQAATLVNAVNNQMSHTPTQPSDMDDDLYQLGRSGASNSNLGWGLTTLGGAIVNGWTYDGSSSNLSRIGHRRWVLNPTMKYTGFGMVDKYSAMYSCNQSRTSSYKNVVWPAQMMPTDYFGTSYPWSISTGATEDINSVKITLTRTKDQQSWTFSNDSSDGAFYVDNDPYGLRGALIFRPNDVSRYNAGDVFHVKAEGLVNGTLEYDVTFFDLVPMTEITLDKESIVLEEGNKYYLSTITHVSPENTTDSRLTWASSDESIASVSGTTVTAHKAGDAILTVKNYDGSVTKSISIHVHKFEYTETKDGIAYFKCTSCDEVKSGKVPTSYNVYWQPDGDTYYYPSISKKQALGSSCGYWIRDLSYSATSDNTYSDMVIELEDPDAAVITPTSRYLGSITWNKAGSQTVYIYPKYNKAASKKITFTITKPLSGVTISPDKTSPQKFGNTVTFTAVPDGGQGTLTYQFTQIDADGKETVIQDYSKTATCTWTPDKTGAFSIRVDVKDSADTSAAFNAVSDKFVIDPAPVAIKEGTSIPENQELTYGDPISKLETDNAVFVSQVTGMEVTGTLSWDDKDNVPSAGQGTANWTFTPESDNFEKLQGSTKFTVAKALPEISRLPDPIRLTYHPAKTLKDVSIGNGNESVPGTWKWVDDTLIPEVKTNSAKAEFVPDDTANYANVTKDIELQVSKAKPVIKDAITTNITYGQTLSDSSITAKTIYSFDEDGIIVDGTCQWKEGSLKPSVADSSVTLYDIVFTPADTDNYESAQGVAILGVLKAEIAPDAPKDKSFSVPFSTETLSNDLLKDYDNWVFEESQAGSGLVAGETKEFNAVYTGADADNYVTTSVTVKVTRSNCDHKNTEIRNQKDATCAEEGYTGDTYCTDCGEKIKDGTTIPKTGHKNTEVRNQKDATCAEEGYTGDTYCTDCGEKIKDGETIPKTNDHKNTEVRGQKDATCTEDGYTGDTYCTDCGEKIKDGTTISKTGHKNTEVRNQKDATCAEEGYTGDTYCTDCGEKIKDGETIPKTNDHKNTEVRDKVDATYTQEGYTGDTYCKDCGELIKKGEIIPKLSTPEDPKGNPSDPQTVAGTERQITSMTNDGDAKGSSFRLLQLRASKVKKNSNTLKWTKVPNASGYIVYGNRCGTRYRYKQMAVVKGTSWTHKKLTKGTYYKYLVVAYRIQGGVQKVIASSKTVHVATKGGKVGNYKAVKVNKKSVKLKKGKAFKIKAKAKPASKKLKVKKHRKICFESSNPRVATVSGSGKIKGKQKGSCIIYVYAQSGTFAKVKVKVK